MLDSGKGDPIASRPWSISLATPLRTMRLSVPTCFPEQACSARMTSPVFCLLYSLKGCLELKRTTENHLHHCHRDPGSAPKNDHQTPQMVIGENHPNWRSQHKGGPWNHGCGTQLSHVVNIRGFPRRALRGTRLKGDTSKSPFKLVDRKVSRTPCPRGNTSSGGERPGHNGAIESDPLPRGRGTQACAGSELVGETYIPKRGDHPPSRASTRNICTFGFTQERYIPPATSDEGSQRHLCLLSWIRRGKQLLTPDDTKHWPSIETLCVLQSEVETFCQTLQKHSRHAGCASSHPQRRHANSNPAFFFRIPRKNQFQLQRRRAEDLAGVQESLWQHNPRAGGRNSSSGL